MILIALLIALSIERVMHMPAFWQMDVLLLKWLDWSQQKLSSDHQQKLNHPAIQMIWLILPALLAGLLVSWLDHGLVTFVASIIALLVAISCQPARDTYKAYLQAANKGDDEALQQQQQKLQAFAGVSAEHNVADTVSWLNYQYYIAGVFCFVAFGGFGALAYATIRSADIHYRERLAALPLSRIRWAMDFIPVRLTGLGLLIVGHFSRALPVWLASLTNLKRTGTQVLSVIIRQAEDMPHHPDDKTDAVATQLSLMKRQQIVWLCVIALLTLAGGLH